MLRSDFIIAVFKLLKFPVTQSRIYFGVAWAAYEDCKALNNPWATTQPYPDSTDFNTVGVKNYKSWDDGVLATASTLINGNYTELVSLLKLDNVPITNIMSALNASSWGSKVTIALYTDVIDKYDTYNTNIDGSPNSVVDEVKATVSEITDINKKENIMNDEVDTLEARLAKLYDAIPATPATPVPDVTEPATTPVNESTEPVDTLESRLENLNEQVVPATTPVTTTDVSTLEQELAKRGITITFTN